MATFLQVNMEIFLRQYQLVGLLTDYFLVQTARSICLGLFWIAWRVQRIHFDKKTWNFRKVERKRNLQVAVDEIEWADVGDGRGDPAVVREHKDCVVKLDVSRDSVIMIGSLLISLQVSAAISEIVIDIRRPPERVLVSYVIVVVYSSSDETPSGETL